MSVLITFIKLIAVFDLLVIAVYFGMEADIDIVVLYNNTRVDRSKCPEAVRYHGNHVAMMYYRDGKYYWDYPAVKKALQ